MENHLRIAGVVILYRPNWNEVVENINSYFPYLEQLYIFDNTEGAASALPDALASLPHLTYFNEGVNEGIAKRLNQACELAIGKGYDWLLTMDQDSSFVSSNEFLKYLELIYLFPEKKQVAVFGVDHECSHLDTKIMYVEKDHVITSGSVLNLPIVRKVGKFDESLFIDGVDVDFCFASKIQGFKIIMFPHIHLKHKIGMEAKQKLGLKNRTLHTPVRFYYMVRNYFYLRKKYPVGFSSYQRGVTIDLLNRIKNYLLLGKDKKRMLSYVFKGWRDFQRKKMGKYSYS